VSFMSINHLTWVISVAYIYTLNSVAVPSRPRGELVNG
jgi:hypothetical protein